VLSRPASRAKDSLALMCSIASGSNDWVTWKYRQSRPAFADDAKALKFIKKLYPVPPCGFITQ
jgi:hypothetical protein